MEYILFIIGFVILIGGATLLIDGASAIGRKLGISEAITGLTIVAIGTSLPELIINLFASIEGSTDLAISNVLGSNIINILGIVGLTALISPIPVSKHTYIRDIPFSMLAVALLFLLVQDQWFSAGNQNVVGRTDGFIFIALLFVFLYIYYRSSKSALKEEIHAKVRPLWLALTFIMAGITGLYFGGEWIVAGAVRVAGLFGMDESTVGLTIIAAATSLPELVTSIGNAVGSCIFNILLVLGLSSVISPLPFSPASLLDLVVALLATVTLVVFVYTGGGRKISRVEGGLMIMLYAGYLWWILT